MSQRSPAPLGWRLLFPRGTGLEPHLGFSWGQMGLELWASSSSRVFPRPALLSPLPTPRTLLGVSVSLAQATCESCDSQVRKPRILQSPPTSSCVCGGTSPPFAPSYPQPRRVKFAEQVRTPSQRPWASPGCPEGKFAVVGPKVRRAGWGAAPGRYWLQARSPASAPGPRGFTAAVPRAMTSRGGCVPGWGPVTLPATYTWLFLETHLGKQVGGARGRAVAAGEPRAQDRNAAAAAAAARVSSQVRGRGSPGRQDGPRDARPSVGRALWRQTRAGRGRGADGAHLHSEFSSRWRQRVSSADASLLQVWERSLELSAVQSRAAARAQSRFPSCRSFKFAPSPAARSGPGSWIDSDEAPFTFSLS